MAYESPDVEQLEGEEVRVMNSNEESKRYAVFLKRFDEKNRRLAKELDQIGAVYIMFGMLDGLNLSYSTIKYFFDILCTNTKQSSSDVMHDWALTPVGIAVAAVESVSMIVFSMLANHFKDKDKNFLKRYIAVTWPYVRDTLKGLKNSYKGLRSLLYTIHELGGKNLDFMMVPLSLTLGVLSVLNRIWYRHMKTGRKQMQDDNALLRDDILKDNQLHVMFALPDDLINYKNSYILSEDIEPGLYYVDSKGVSKRVSIVDDDLLESNISKLKKSDQSRIFLSRAYVDKLILANGNALDRPDNPILSDEEIDSFRRRIRRQTVSARWIGLGSAAYSGFIDGLYLYMGMYALASVIPPAFLVMSIFSAIFVSTNVITRIYEEYDYQKKLEISAAKAEFALSIQVVKSVSYEYQQRFSRALIDPHLTSSDRKQLVEDIFQKVEQAKNDFELRREKLKSLQMLSHKAAFLSGLKNGLSGYGVIASFLFAMGTIFALSGVVFPPALLMAGVLFGVVSLVAFTAHGMIQNYRYQKAQHLKDQQELEQSLKDPCLNALDNFLHEIKAAEWDVKKENERDLLVRRVVDTFEEHGLSMDPSPQYFFQEWFEVLRSFFSGSSKGVKAIDYAFNPLQKAGPDGHYHETPVMLILILLSGVLNSVVLALRAHARGFGRSIINEDRPFRDAEKIAMLTPVISPAASGLNSPDDDSARSCSSSPESERKSLMIDSNESIIEAAAQSVPENNSVVDPHKNKPSNGAVSDGSSLLKQKIVDGLCKKAKVSSSIYGLFFQSSATPANESITELRKNYLSPTA